MPQSRQVAPLFDVHVTEDRGTNWFRFSGAGLRVWSRGGVFSGGELLVGRRLAEALASAAAPARADSARRGLTEFVTRLNGHFAAIVEGGDFVFAAVDRCRSMPLFYATVGGRLALSDRARWVQRRSGGAEMDELAGAEFLLTGFVTGAETLCPLVKQLQAGELLWWAPKQGGPPPTTHRYYRYLHDDSLSADPRELYPILSRALENAFDRLLHLAGERCIVAPLSGGLDSRLVAAMLKKAGARNVICFSYGRANHWEARMSRRVAETLGFAWKFVPFTRRKWRAWFDSRQRKDYFDLAINLTSMALMQDWPAVWELRRAGDIPDDSVFVPGHAASSRGGHLPRSFERSDRVGPGAVVDALLDHYYAFRRPSKALDALRPELAARIARSLADTATETPRQAASAFEYWAWREYQAKFIINWLRVYEFWGYSWHMPLFDTELAAFFAKLPFRLRRHRRFYGRYLYENVFEELGIAYRPTRREFRTSDMTRLRNRLFDPWYGKYDGRLNRLSAWGLRNKDIAPLDHPLINKNGLAYLEPPNGLNTMHQLWEIRSEWR